MVFGTHPRHVTSDLMKLTKFHRGFLRHLSFLSNCSSLTTERLIIWQKERCAINWFCAVLQCVRGAQLKQRTWAHAHYIALIIRFEQRHILVPLFRKKTFSSAPAPFPFSLQAANAQVAAQCILLFRFFFSISRKGGCMLQRWCYVVAQNLLKAIHAPF